METPLQLATRLKDQQSSDQQGRRGPFIGTVVSIQGDADTMGIQYGPTRSRTMPIVHPFVSGSSWIRSIPEAGTPYLMVNRFDSNQAEALKTIPISASRSSDYLSGLNLYRNLSPGEHDMASSGAALMYMSRQGNLDLRSNASLKHQLSFPRQEILSQAPTHVMRLVNGAVGTMGDEHRIGVVKRWTNAVDEMYPQDANGNFQQEEFTSVKNLGSGPPVLFTHHEGQLYDQDGHSIQATNTGLALRSRSQWYTTRNQTLAREIDQAGNVSWSFPQEASVGYAISIPGGSHAQTIGLNRDVTIGQDDQLIVQGDQLEKITGRSQREASDLQFGDGVASFRAQDGKIAIGTSAVELLALISELLETLSTTTAAGFGLPLSTVAQFAALKIKIDSIVGSLG